MEQTLRNLISELVERASVTWDIDEDGVSTVHVVPHREQASTFSVAWSAHEIVVSFDKNARIELGPGEQDLPLLRQIVSAIVQGRVVRLVRPRGISYRVTLGNETDIVASGGGLLSGLGSQTEVLCEPY